MKILLIAPVKERYMGFAQYPPVGLGYLATAARKIGHQVKILDCVKEHIDLAEFTRRIEKEDFDIAGITVWSLAIKEVKKSIEIIKQFKPETIVILGGPHPSALPEETLNFFPQADFAFKGEGEIGFPLFVEAIKNKSVDFSTVPGLIYRSADKIIVNDLKFEENLDTLGFPSWDLINPREYFMPGSLIGKDTSVLTCTRGCPYHCSFCSAWITAGRKIRRRSIQNILEEVEYLNTKYGIKIFDIPDENFTFDKKFVMDFCHAVLPYKRKFEFFLPNGIRLDSLDKELLVMMRKAGFRREVAVGIESGSERVLKMMKKNLSLELVRDKVDLLNRAGFHPIGYFILGFPGETLEDINKTIKLAMELKLWAAAFTPFSPMPGTEATNQLLEKKELPQDFDFTEVATDKVSYAPQGISKDTLDKIRKKALLRFNLRWRPLVYYLRNYESLKFAAMKFFNLFVKGGQVKNEQKEY